MTNYTLTNVLLLFLVLEAGFCLAAKVRNKTRGGEDDAELTRHNGHDHDCTRPKVNYHFQYTLYQFPSYNYQYCFIGPTRRCHTQWLS